MIRSLAALSPENRPRERCLRDGAHALDPHDLLALVLGTGRGQNEDALQLAHRVLEELDGLEGLARASLPRLLRITGIGPVKAVRIRAAFEIALRAGPVEPEIDPLQHHYTRLRGQIPTGEKAIVGYRPDGKGAPVTLGLGECLGRSTRAGSFMARLLTSGSSGPWWIVSLRPGGPPKGQEVCAAKRLAEAATLLELPLPRIVLLTGQGAWSLLELQ